MVTRAPTQTRRKPKTKTPTKRTSTAAKNASELGVLADQINTSMVNIATGYIEVGRALLKARAMFKGDLEFGRWRKANTMINSSQTALGLMQVAAKFGDDQDLQVLPKSTLVALVSAPQGLIDEVKEEVNDGTKPTRAEVQARKQKLQRKSDEESEEETSRKAPQNESAAAKIAAAAPDSQTNIDTVMRHTGDTLSLPLEFRMKDKDASCWVKFGITDLCDGMPCSVDVIRLLRAAYEAQSENNDKLANQIEDAYAEIMDYFK